MDVYSHLHVGPNVKVIKALQQYYDTDIVGLRYLSYFFDFFD